MTFSASAVVRVEKKRREREYEELYKSARSPFKGMELKKIFLYSVAIGYYKNKRSPLEKPLHDLFQAARTLTPEEEWFIKSIAIKTAGDLSILSNERKVLNIAEEFANAGILILHDIIFTKGSGEPLMKLLNEIYDVLQRGHNVNVL